MGSPMGTVVLFVPLMVAMATGELQPWNYLQSIISIASSLVAIWWVFVIYNAKHAKWRSGVDKDIAQMRIELKHKADEATVERIESLLTQSIETTNQFHKEMTQNMRDMTIQVTRLAALHERNGNRSGNR